MKTVNNDSTKPSISNEVMLPLIRTNAWGILTNLLDKYSLPEDMSIVQLLLIELIKSSEFGLITIIAKFKIAQDILVKNTGIYIRLFNKVVENQHWLCAKALLSINIPSDSMIAYDHMAAILADKNPNLSADLQTTAYESSKRIWAVQSDEIEQMIITLLKSGTKAPCYQAIEMMLETYKLTAKHKLLILMFAVEHNNWALVVKLIDDPKFSKVLIYKVCQTILPKAIKAGCLPVINKLWARIEDIEKKQSQSQLTKRL